jgi:flagellar biosynthetic protein FliO
MKVFLRNLIVIALFIMPAYGQLASTPAQTTDGNSNGNNVALLDTPATAAPVAVAPIAEAQGTNLGFPVLRTIGGLGLVLCLMIAGYFAAKKFAPRFFAKSASEKNLKVIETLSMGDKRSISMIEIGNSRYLIGNTPHQINLLAALPEPISMVSEPEALPSTPKSIARNESAVPFRNLFEVEKKRSTQYAGNPLPEDIRTKMRQLREALER